MRSASPPSPPGRHRASLRRRAAAFLLALAAELLIVLVLLTLSPKLASPPRVPRPNVFGFAPSPEAKPVPKPAPRSKAAPAKHPAGESSPAAPAPPVPPAATNPAPVVPPVKPLLDDKALFDAGDISKIAARPNGRAEGSGAGDTGNGRDSASAYGPGDGPGGETLYNAEWYQGRRPTHAELAYYLPHEVPPDSWAMIACRTIENYHVENCRPLGESPIGSGLARGLREAAWQFRVLPPRIGGRAIIGAWVRIRIDFTELPPAR